MFREQEGCERVRHLHLRVFLFCLRVIMESTCYRREFDSVCVPICVYLRVRVRMLVHVRV